MKRLIGMACLVLCFGLFGFIVFHFATQRESRPVPTAAPVVEDQVPAPKAESPVEASRQEEPTATAPPADSGKRASAYELLKFPFRNKGELVTLDTIAIPLVFEGNVVQYPRYAPRTAAASGLIGLRFNRQLREDAYLYDVMTLAASGSSEPEVGGQILLAVKEGASPPDQSRLWEVEPLGLVEGTNGFGGQLQIPTVRFWDYSNERMP